MLNKHTKTKIQDNKTRLPRIKIIINKINKSKKQNTKNIRLESKNNIKHRNMEISIL